MSEEISIDGYTEDQIGYHIHLLAQAGFVIAQETGNITSTVPSAHPISLTWAGHEFLDASRDSKLWAKAKKEVIAPAGGVAITVLMEWLKSEAKVRLGLPP